MKSDPGHNFDEAFSRLRSDLHKWGAPPATYWSQIRLFERSVILKDRPLTRGDRICRDQTCLPRHSTGGLAKWRGHYEHEVRGA